MKIQVFSDIHLEFGGYLPPLNPSADVVVIAGDVAPLESHDGAIEQIAERYAGVPIIYVLGNHEFYGGNLTEIRDYARTTSDRYGVSLLDPGIVLLNGVRFIGATLWTDWMLNGVTDDFRARCEAEQGINDYRGWITYGEDYINLNPGITADLHWEDRVFIEQELAIAEKVGQDAVVVTHHAPSPQSINDKYTGSGLNPSYASDLDNMIGRYQPLAWIHGHMHDPVYKMLGDTRLVCNPGGYGHETVSFNPDLLIEV